MEIITKATFLKDKSKYIALLKEGAVCIYPTDTIYGIGCDATNATAVQVIRKAKAREEKPFSIIAPSKDWIVQNCVIPKEGAIWLDKLPGPYTLVLKLKKQSIATEVSFGTTVGVRIPNNWFSSIVQELGFPFVTTSVNLQGEKHMTSLTDLDERIQSYVTFCIDEGKKQGRPSTIVRLDQEKITVHER